MVRPSSPSASTSCAAASRIRRQRRSLPCSRRPCSCAVCCTKVISEYKFGQAGSAAQERFSAGRRLRRVPATLDWLGCATFRLTVDDLVVFLDAHMDRVPSAPTVGMTTGDVDRADWVVVGHSHFDHLWGAETIARNTGAKVLRSYETVRVMQEQGVPNEQLLPVAGGERVRLGPDVTVTAFPSQHSCVWSQTKMTDADEACIGDLGLTYQEKQARFAALAEW